MPGSWWEELQPLVAYAILYLILLIFLRLFLWPLLLAFRTGRFLPRALRGLAPLLLRVGAMGLLALGAMWAVVQIGWGGDWERGLAAFPVLTFTLPRLGTFQVSFLLIALLLLLLIAIGSTYAYRRRR